MEFHLYFIPKILLQRKKGWWILMLLCCCYIFSLFTFGWKMMMYCIWLREVRKKGLDVNGYVACFLIKLSFFTRNVLMKEIVCLTLKRFELTRVNWVWAILTFKFKFETNEQFQIIQVLVYTHSFTHLPLLKNCISFLLLISSL